MTRIGLKICDIGIIFQRGKEYSPPRSDTSTEKGQKRVTEIRKLFEKADDKVSAP